MPLDPAAVKAAFLAAAAIDDRVARAALLDERCGGDQALLARVHALLAANDREVASDGTVPYGGPADAADAAATASRPGRDEHVGAVIAGKYKLVEEIGEGGMGSVYMAQQTEPVKRAVAVKVIKAGMDSKGVLARFDAERQALALMDHPNIARVLDAGATESGRPFFVMELVKGVPITDFCDARRLSVRERLALFVPVCQAIQHAHQKGVIHRDIKPSNVLVALYDDRPVPKVIDFGIAKAAGQPLTDHTLMTGFGAVVGTPEYMSPEQASLNNLDIDTRSDVYSLGVLLYELLTGGTPVDRKALGQAALLEVLRIVREVEAPRPSAKLSTMDTLPSVAVNRGTEPASLSRLMRGELDWVLLKALEKDRTRRYDSANGLAQDLQRYLADEVVEARPPSRGYRLRKFVRRNKGQVVAASLVLLALVGGVVGTTLGMVRAESERKRSDDLARANADLAEQESDAKHAANKLADDNAKLAAAERDAKNAAVEATREREQQLLRTKTILLNSQIERAAQVQERDPAAALSLLHDADACPLDMRDMAWNFLDHACNRRQYALFTVPDSRLLRFQVISPDGKWLATVQNGVSSVPNGLPEKGPPERAVTGKVTVFEIPSGKVRAELPAFPAGIQCLAFSPDGSQLAVVADGRVGQPIRDEKGKPIPPVKVPGKVQIWDVAERKNLATLEGHTDHVLALAFSADGARLATGSMDTTARVWDLKSAKEQHAFTRHGKEVAAVAFSPDGRRLATGGLDNAVKVWDLDGFKPVSAWTPAANPNPAWAATQVDPSSPQGFWEENAGIGLAGHSDGVIDLDFSPDGNSLVAANANWLIEIRDAASGQLRTTLGEFTAPAKWVRFHREGKSVFVAQPNAAHGLTQWDATTGQRLLGLPRPITQQVAGAFCKGRSLFALTGPAIGHAVDAHAADGTGRLVSPGVYECRVLDLDAPVERAAFRTEKVTGNPAIPAFSPAGDVLAVGCGDRIFLWDVRTGHLRKTLVGHKNHVVGLAFSPDGRTLASSSTVGGFLLGRLPDSGPDDVRLWDTATGEPLGTIPIGQPAIPSIAFSPDGKTLATLHWTGVGPVGNKGTAVASLWDVSTRQLQFTLEHTNDATALALQERSRLAFNPADGTLLMLAGRHVGIWDLPTRTLRRRILTGAVGTSGASEFVSMAIRPDGKWLATASTKIGGAVELKVWDPDTGELVKTLDGTRTQTVAFSPDGKNLLTMSGNTVHIWDAVTLQKRVSFDTHPSAGGSLGMPGLAVSADGQTVATAVLPTTGGPTGHSLREGIAEVKLWDVSRSPTRVTIPTTRLMHSKFSFISGGGTLMEKDDNAGVIRLWDPGTGRVLSTIDTTRNKIGSLLSPDNRYLAVTDIEAPEADKSLMTISRPGACQGVVNLWDLKTSTLRTVRVGKGVPTGLAFSPDGKTMAILHNTTIRSNGDTAVKDALGSSVEVWSLAEGRSTANWPVEGVHLSFPAFSPDGDTLVVNASTLGRAEEGGRRTLVVDLRTGRVLHTLREPGDGDFFPNYKFTTDGTRLLVRRGASTEPITVWDWRAGRRVDERVPDAFGNPDVSPDGRYELKRLLHGVEVIDRTVTPPAVVSHRRRP